MNRKEAREKLSTILATQKTVRISRLKEIMDAIDVESLVKQNVEQGKTIKDSNASLKELRDKYNGLNGRKGKR